MPPAPKPIKIPKITPELCELVGAIAGDGSIQNGKAGYRVSLYGNQHKDYEYMKYLSKQIEKLFGLKSKLVIKPGKSCVYFTIYSKNLCEYFIKKFDFSYGKKSDTLQIPRVIRANNTWLIAFIRGLFDTDGCVTWKNTGKYSYRVIKITTNSSKLAYGVKDSLIENKVACHIGKKKQAKRGEIMSYDVVVSKQRMIKKWIELISSKNQRNKKKLDGVAEI